jgi:hypothetical protein
VSEGSEAIVFSGKVDEKGHVKPDEVNRTRGRLTRWKGRRVTVTVKRYAKPKTSPQLGLYFMAGGILDCWADYIGDDRDGAHADLKRAFLVPVLEDPEIGDLGLLSRVSKITGEEEGCLPSLADLTSRQMSAYLDRVIREGAQRGIVFDLPAVAS